MFYYGQMIKLNYFFYKFKGSGIGLLENKKQIKINYGGNNKKKYSSIGKFLKKNSSMEKLIYLQ